MKPVGSFRHCVALGLLAAVAFLAQTAEAVENYAVVRAIRGTASFSQDQGRTWQTANVGNQYNPSTIVRTGVDSMVDLFLDENGPVVRMTEQTELALSKLSYNPTSIETIIETELDLRNGRILGNVRRLAEASTYEVVTPLGVAGIRGTEYDISVNGVVHVVTGTVVVAYINTQDPNNPFVVTVNEGETAYPPSQPGEAPRVEPTPGDVATRLAREFEDLRVVVVRYTTTENPDDPNNLRPEAAPPPQPILLVPEPFISPTIGAEVD